VNVCVNSLQNDTPAPSGSPYAGLQEVAALEIHPITPRFSGKSSGRKRTKKSCTLPLNLTVRHSELPYPVSYPVDRRKVLRVTARSFIKLRRNTIRPFLCATLFTTGCRRTTIIAHVRPKPAEKKHEPLDCLCSRRRVFSYLQTFCNIALTVQWFCGILGPHAV